MAVSDIDAFVRKGYVASALRAAPGPTATQHHRRVHRLFSSLCNERGRAFRFVALPASHRPTCLADGDSETPPSRRPWRFRVRRKPSDVCHRHFRARLLSLSPSPPGPRREGFASIWRGQCTFGLSHPRRWGRKTNDRTRESRGEESVIWAVEESARHRDASSALA